MPRTSTAATPAQAQPTESLWAIPAWRLAFPASVINRLGDFIFDTTIVLWIGTHIGRGQAWAPSAVSGVLIAAMLPVLVLGPVAGVFCDRHDKHRIMLWSNIIQAVAMASLLLLIPLSNTLGVAGQLVWIYAAIFVTNAAGQFYTTARVVMIQKTIPDDLLTKAFATQGGANSVAAMVGPPLAAPLLFAAGIQWALTLNALSFVVCTALMAAVSWDSRPTPEAVQDSFGESFTAGLQVLRTNPIIIAILLGITVATLGTGIINTLEVFFVTDVLRSPAGLLGILGACFAAGTVAGMSLATLVEKRIGAPRAFLYGLLLVGLLLVALSRSTTFWVAALMYIGAAVPLGVLNAVTSPLVMRSVAPELLGRVASVVNMLPTVAALVSMAATGWLASTVMRNVDFTLVGSHFGPIDTLFTVAGMLIVIAGAIVWRPIITHSQGART